MVTRTEALAKLTAAGQPYELFETEMYGRKIRAFRNAPPSLRELYGNHRSDLPYIIYNDETLTFEETWVRACALAHKLVNEYGVQKGDRVAVSMRNYPEWIIAFMAATSVGAIAVAMNAMWQPHEMGFGLNDSGAKVLIADEERLDRFAAIENPPSEIRLIVTRATRDLPDGVASLEDIFKAGTQSEMPPAEIGPNDRATMFYTSGSTGNPKGVVSSHRSVISALISWELDEHAGVMIGLIPQPDPNAPQGAALLGIPLFHVTGAHVVFLSSYRRQRRLVTMYKWDAEKAAELIEKYRVTGFAGPAAVTGDLVAVAQKSNRDLSSLVAVSGGGAARPPEQVRAIEEVFENARPGTGWGMTETNAIGTGIGSDDYLERPESSGRVSAVLDIRIVAEDGAVLGPNERGELQIRGTSIMEGYWNRPDADAETFVDGDWMRTGDVAYLDDEGFVFIVDRIKDLVIRGGENIGCGRVEAALQDHPAIVEACVFGVPDERLGEEVASIAYVTAPVDEEQLRAFLAERLAKFEIPRYMEFRTEPLPRIATGKFAKRQMRTETVERMGKAAT